MSAGDGRILVNLRIVERPERVLHSGFVLADGQPTVHDFVQGELSRKGRSIDELLHAWKTSANGIEKSCIMRAMTVPLEMFCGSHETLGLELVIKQQVSLAAADSFRILMANMQELDRLKVSQVIHFHAPVFCR